jgi:transcriptional regulator GlxA family with amidase domain
MNGVTVEAQQPLEFANEADVVLFGSGIYTRAIADSIGKAGSPLDRLQLDPIRQTIGAQCSGALLMARLGLLADMPACTDATTRPWLMEAGVRVEESAFHARGPIATAGGCLASPYLAAWVMLRGAGREATSTALQYVAPVGDGGAFVRGVLAVVEPFVD